MNLKLSLTIFFISLFTGAISQTPEDSHSHEHDRYKNEFAIANSPVYFCEGKSLRLWNSSSLYQEYHRYRIRIWGRH